MATFYDQILDRLVTVLRSNKASLTRVSEDEEIQKRRDFYTADQIYEGITVHKGSRRGGDGGPFNVDDYIYPCFITYVYGATVDEYDADEDAHAFVDLVTRLWQGRRCGVTFSNNSHEMSCMVQDADLEIPEMFYDNYIVVSVVVNVEIRQERTAL